MDHLNQAITISDSAISSDKGGILNTKLTEATFWSFVKAHQPILKTILCQGNVDLIYGPLATLRDNPAQVIDLETKNKIFAQQLDCLNNSTENLKLVLRRAHLFEDGPGVTRKWFTLLSREILQAQHGLFVPCPNGPSQYSVNGDSDDAAHLDRFKFVGRLIGKAILKKELLEEPYRLRQLHRELGSNTVVVARIGFV